MHEMTRDATALFGSDLWQALFAPRHIALIGQSDNPRRPTGRPLKYLRRDGYDGAIYPINPRRTTVQGEPAYSGLDDLPERPDHAYILLDTDLAIQAFESCCAMRVPVVQILADGFAESGADGAARQVKLTSLAQQAGVRLLGPNCMGIADLNSGLSLTVNAVFDEEFERGGRTALISQSGSMMGGLMSRAAQIGLRFSKIAAVGNEADLGVGEIGQMLAGDPDTDVILLFMETIRQPHEIAKFAAVAHAAGKPIIAFKLGRSSVGQELAVAHTGALLSEDSVVDAFFKDLGIVRVTMLEALIEAATLCRGRAPQSKCNPKVGVVTTTGGGGAAACDQLAHVGVNLLTPSDETVAKIRNTGVNVSPGPLTDVTLAGARADVIGPSLKAMGEDADCDIVLCVLGSSSRASPETALAPVISADVSGKTLAAFLVPDAVPGLRMLVDRNIAAFRTPESCADALRAYCAWRPSRIEHIAPPATITETRNLDEDASLALLAEAGVPIVPRVTLPLGDLDEAELPFGFPVVAKVLSDKIAHKTEAGGVIVDIPDHAGLIAAGQTI
ncbi:MAG: acetate--CoA ligase family protein, partial [Hyphomicrobiaceae bacterium]